MLSVCLETAMIAEYAGTTNHAGLSMGVFFSFCFISFYGGGIDVVGYVYCCKCIPILPSASMHERTPGNTNAVEQSEQRRTQLAHPAFHLWGP